MKKLFAVLVAAVFGVASIGVFAASHTGAAPMKDAPKVDCKDPKNKDDKACMAKKDVMKVDCKDPKNKDNKDCMAKKDAPK